jgi:hypothetical protein
MDNDEYEELERDPPSPPPPPPVKKLRDKRERIHDRNERRRRLKHITIRGINPDLYEEFTEKVKTLGMHMGEAVNQMMTDIIGDFDDSFPSLSAKGTFGKVPLEKAHISHHAELSIGRKDLEEANVRFYFSHIDELTVESDVDLETFQKYILEIRDCRFLRIPKVLPKLLLLSKIRHCDEIDTYTVESKELTEEKE